MKMTKLFNWIKRKFNMTFRPKAYLIELGFRMLFPYSESKGKVNMRLARIINDLCTEIGFEKNLGIGNYIYLRYIVRDVRIIVSVDHIESNQLTIIVRTKDDDIYSEIVNLNQESKDYNYKDVALLCLAMVL